MRYIKPFLISILLFFQTFCIFAEDKAVSSETIVIYGDSRSGHHIHKKIVSGIIKMRPQAVFHTGDLVNDGFSLKDWDIFNKITSRLVKTAEFYPALGNHEAKSRLFFKNFDLPDNKSWYSVEKADIHFIILDSNANISKDSPQYRWFKEDLEGIAETVKFVVVIFHHPLFSTGIHLEDEKRIRRVIEPLLRLHKVEVVFNGHNHAYERSKHNNIYHITTGGGGAPLHGQRRRSPESQLFVKAYHFCKLSVVGDKLQVEVFDINLKLIDKFHISKRR